MKYFLVISFLIGICFVNAGTISKRPLMKNKDVTEQLLDLLRELIKQGNPQAGIPILDPYQFQHKQINFENNIFRLAANITNGNFLGLSSFQMRKFSFNPEKDLYTADWDVNFPSLNFTSEYYKMTGSIKNLIPLAGEGLAHVEIYDVNIWSKMYLKFDEDKGTILVDRIGDPGFTVSRIVSKTEFDKVFDDIANAMIEDLLAGYLNRFNQYLAITYSPIIVDALNEVLSKES